MYSQQLPLFFSPESRWDGNARHRRGKKKKERSRASSGAAGQKIANILRHRRHRERDGAFNWRPVYIHIYLYIYSETQAIPLLHFPPCGRLCSWKLQNLRTIKDDNPLRESTFWHFNLIQVCEIRKKCVSIPFSVTVSRSTNISEWEPTKESWLAFVRQN